jgi:hypothetical protein
VEASRVELVVDGVLRHFLMSRIPRAQADERSTGHGRGLGAERRQAMPGVVQVEPHRTRSQRRLKRKALTLAREAGLPYVLVVGRMEPLSLVEDFEVAFSGDGPLAGLTRPTEAWRLYPDGRVEPVRGLGFVGVDRRALRDVAMAGELGPPVDMMDAGEGSRRYSIGAVGGLPVTWQAPPVLITELELYGASGGEPHSYPAP